MSMSTPANLSPDEQRAYDIITARGEIPQSELWKQLETNSRTGSRLATSLAEKGLIERESTTTSGHRTYLLTSTNGTSNASVQTAGDPTVEHDPTELPAREERALSLIQGQGGIYQSDLWKELDVSSRTGSRIATSLEEKELIRREPTTHNGRRTYLLLPPKKDLDFSLLLAGNMLSPLIGAEEGIDPIDADEFTQWILQLSQKNQ